MRIVETIDINAPLRRVFDVSVDVERWAEWTPSIERIEIVGSRTLGHGATAMVKQPGTSTALWQVTEFVPGERFAWETRAPGARMVGVHRVEPLEGGGTRATLGVETSGLLAPLFDQFIRSTALRFVRWEARGLKLRCEDPRYLWRQHEEDAKA